MNILNILLSILYANHNQNDNVVVLSDLMECVIDKHYCIAKNNNNKPVSAKSFQNDTSYELYAKTFEMLLSNKNEIKSIIAKDNVFFIMKQKTKTTTLKASQCEYQVDIKQILCTENVVLKEDSNTLTGDKCIGNIETQQYKIVGSKNKVTAIFVPTKLDSQRKK